MKTKNIFKTLVLAAVLVSACGKNEIADDFKGYTLPVTINVTRQGDATTRATFDGSKLAFTAGDKLFVEALNSDAGQFAGLLDYNAVSRKFSGTIYTESQYTGTVEALLADAVALMATLLPAGYDTNGYGYLSISNAGAYNADLLMVRNKVCALTKKEAVEQLSLESVYEYDNGFALAPQNAVVCFSISGLTANTAVEVIFKETSGDPVSPVNVTTDASGVATFAVGMPGYENFDNFSLTVDGFAIALPADKEVLAGKIYNMSRSMPVVTWNSSKVAGIDIVSGDPEYNSFESDGFTVAAFAENGSYFMDSEMSVDNGYFTFTSSVGKIKKIEINYTGDALWDEPSDGWSLVDGTFTWSGTPATSVTLSSSGLAGIVDITSIVFTLE